MFLQSKVWIRVLGVLMFALINIGHMKGVEYSLLSPDGKLEVRVVRTDKGTFEYKFSMGNKLVIDSSPIVLHDKWKQNTWK